MACSLFFCSNIPVILIEADIVDIYIESCFSTLRFLACCFLKCYSLNLGPRTVCHHIPGFPNCLEDNNWLYYIGCKSVGCTWKITFNSFLNWFAFVARPVMYSLLTWNLLHKQTDLELTEVCLFCLQNIGINKGVCHHARLLNLFFMWTKINVF